LAAVAAVDGNFAPAGVQVGADRSGDLGWDAGKRLLQLRKSRRIAIGADAGRKHQCDQYEQRAIHGAPSTSLRVAPSRRLSCAASSTGASAAITRSGGNVTITSVPIRSFDFSVKLPPCMSTRLFAMGSPRPAPCSADLMEFEPCPNEASTIGISSSGIPGPVSL